MKDHTLIVLHKTNESFGYYDVQSGKKLDVIPTKAFPHEVCLSPDRTRIYIAEMGVRGVESEGPGGNTVSVYDAKSHKKVSEISTAQYDRPHGVATHSNGRLFVTTESTTDPKDNNLLIFDLETEELLHVVCLEQLITHMVNVAPDGKTAYTANIGSNSLTEVDVESGTATANIATLERPEGMIFSPDGKLIYCVCRESRAVVIIDRGKREMVDKIETGHGPVRVVITPDGKKLGIPLFHSDSIQIADTETRRVTHTVDVGKAPAGTAISPDGTLVFMACEEEDAVYVFSMETAEIVNKIATEPGCDAMVCFESSELE